MEIRVDENRVQEDCKGRFFRYTEAGFIGQNGRFVVTRELRPLKSISCPGCAECAGLNDELAARANEKGFVQFSPTLASGDTVTLLQVPISRDWGTGQLTKWYYEVNRANTT
ncbi:hypothetical protein [Burkholderia ubonensis]|uniref:hypothetical protein n=1 Tax=Burkholderia ubonensis TaxID=101571 RepID=UPI000B163634|nr:hypothetical protein [Burkholderia ubonensis]